MEKKSIFVQRSQWPNVKKIVFHENDLSNKCHKKIMLVKPKNEQFENLKKKYSLHLATGIYEKKFFCP